MYPVYWSSSHLCVYLNFTLIHRLAYICSLTIKFWIITDLTRETLSYMYDRPSHVGLGKGKKVNMTSSEASLRRGVQSSWSWECQKEKDNKSFVNIVKTGFAGIATCFS